MGTLASVAMQRTNLFLLAIGALVALSACSGGSSGGSEPAGGGAGSTGAAIEPKWSVIYPKIIGGTDGMTGTCALSGSCHQGANPTGLTRLDGGPAAAYANIVGKPSNTDPKDIIVVPGDPDHSFLYKAITGDFTGLDCKSQPAGCGVKMPQTGPSLSSDEIQAIHDWIAMGAMND